MSHFVYILTVVISLSQLNGYESVKEFCTEYAQNSDRIDYSFQLPLVDKHNQGLKLYKTVLVIGQDYWHIFYNRNGNDFHIQTNGFEANFLGKQYATGFTIDFNANYKHISGFLTTANISIIKWFHVEAGDDNRHISDAVPIADETYIDFESDFKPTVSIADKNLKTVCFMSQKRVTTILTTFAQTYRCFNFSSITRPTLLYKTTTDYKRTYEMIGGFGPTNSQYLVVYYDTLNRKQIRYCLIKSIEYDCINGTQGVLVDCSPKSSTGSPSPPTKGVFSLVYFIILAVIICVIIIILIIALRIVVNMKKGNEYSVNSEQTITQTTPSVGTINTGLSQAMRPKVVSNTKNRPKSKSKSSRSVITIK